MKGNLAVKPRFCPSLSLKLCKVTRNFKLSFPYGSNSAKRQKCFFLLFVTTLLWPNKKILTPLALTNCDLLMLKKENQAALFQNTVFLLPRHHHDRHFPNDFGVFAGIPGCRTSRKFRHRVLIPNRISSYIHIIDYNTKIHKFKNTTKKTKIQKNAKIRYKNIK